MFSNITPGVSTHYTRLEFDAGSDDTEFAASESHVCKNLRSAKIKFTVVFAHMLMLFVFQRKLWTEDYDDSLFWFLTLPIVAMLTAIASFVALISSPEMPRMVSNEEPLINGSSISFISTYEHWRRYSTSSSLPSFSALGLFLCMSLPIMTMTLIIFNAHFENRMNLQIVCNALLSVVFIVDGWNLGTDAERILRFKSLDAFLRSKSHLYL